MTECQRCARKTDVFLCATCQSGLRDLLLDLPAWLSWVAEAEIGHVRLGDGGRCNRRDVLTEYADPAPAYDDEGFALGITKGQKRLADDLDDGALTRHKVLAMGRVNTAATRLLHAARNTLSTIVRDLCETRRIDPPPWTAPPGFIGPLPPGWRHAGERGITGSLVCHWLAAHVSAIACEDSAAARYAEVEHLRERAEQIVNRPEPPKPIGPCPTDPAPDDVLAARRESGDHTTRCRWPLTRPAVGSMVTCPQCGQTRDVAVVEADNLRECDDRLVTVRELTDVVLPKIGEPVRERTLHHWIKTRSLERGRDAAGAVMVRIGDIRRVREKAAAL